MPTLHWIGKDKVINHHMDVPFKVLEHSYGFATDASIGSVTVQKEETNSGNKIIHGDNLEVNTLGHAFWATMKTKAYQYVIYADNCLLTKDFMTKHNIIFKKIPRDVTRF